MALAMTYEQDFYSWLMGNAQLLRERKFSDLDIEHIIEELESMGKREKRALVSRLTVLLAHLLKWQFQPAKRSRSWKNTILVQRLDIQELLEDSPSLKHILAEKLDVAYTKAILFAEDETGIESRHFPATCPFSFEQIMTRDFFPEDEAANS